MAAIFSCYGCGKGLQSQLLAGLRQENGLSPGVEASLSNTA